MPILGSFGAASSRGFRFGGISYNISPSTTSVNEGSSVTFTITTTNFGTGTLYWTIAGVSGTISTFDFSSPAGAISGGSVSITNNSGSQAITLNNDTTTEGAESFTFNLRTGSTSGPIVATSATITINDTSVTPTPTPTVPTPTVPTPTPTVPTPTPTVPTPTPTVPTPTVPTPTPTVPTPTNCTPVYSYNEYRAACGTTVAIFVNPCTGAESFTCPTPTPTVPTPTVPTPTVPTPTVPTPTVPTPTAPTPSVSQCCTPNAIDQGCFCNNGTCIC